MDLSWRRLHRKPYLSLLIFHLDIPGTAYYDLELEHLSTYYLSCPEERSYLILLDGSQRVIGGVGIAKFDGFPLCGEIQKLYVADEEKGNGLGKYLMEQVEKEAVARGYQRLYLETHTNLKTAIALYEKMGFVMIDKPKTALHSAMNRFYQKELY